MRKKLFMLISLFLLISSFILINQFQLKNFAVFNTVNPKYAEEVKESLRKAEELGFTALLCNEVRVPFDDAANTFYVPLDMEEEQWEKLEFISGQPEYQILFEKDITNEVKSDVIAGGDRFALLVFDEECWAEYYVTFTGLPIIDLATNEGFYSAEQITGTAMFYDTDFTLRGTQQSEYHGHIRGNTSRMFPKKGYKMNLISRNADGTTVLNKLSLFGMRKDDDWILHALYNDDTKIRDRLSMQVWDTYGAGTVSPNGYYGPKMIYVEVFADNSYCGLYGLMEPVDAKQMDLTEKDYSYKRKNPGSIKYHYTDFNEAKDPYAEVQGFEIKEGPVDKNIYFWEPMANLAAVLTLSDEEFLEQEYGMINEENALKLWLFIQIITGYDHITKNVYYIAKYNEDSTFDYEFYFAPWDMDLTWGRVSVGEVNSVYTDFEWESVHDRIVWDVGNKLLKTNYHHAREYVTELYEELRSTVLTDEAIEEMVFEMDVQLRNSGAFARDKERWPDGVHAQDCSELVEYAKERLAYLDEALYNSEYYYDE